MESDARQKYQTSVAVLEIDRGLLFAGSEEYEAVGT